LVREIGKVISVFLKTEGEFYENQSFALAIALNVFAVAPLWAQEKSPDANLFAQLEKRLTQSESESKRLTGEPKALWLMRKAKIEKVIDRLKAGQSVDPKELDVIFSGRVN
jgi:hypothetical protein